MGGQLRKALGILQNKGFWAEGLAQKFDSPKSFEVGMPAGRQAPGSKPGGGRPGG